MDLTAIHVARFWARVDKGLDDTDCWVWQGPVNKYGYGKVTINGQCLKAHRVAYELRYGPIAPGLCVCHKCDNRKCCNPAHLFPGTVAENNQDMVNKGRQRAPRGPKSHLARLTETEVIAIREAYMRGIGPTALARQYGVSSGAIKGVIYGKSWNHIPSPVGSSRQRRRYGREATIQVGH